jgi:PAS domain S-box-containing protein
MMNPLLDRQVQAFLPPGAAERPEWRDFLAAVSEDYDKFHDNESRLKVLLDNIQTGVVVVEAETHEITDINPAAARMLGITRQEAIGHLCHRFICPAGEGQCPITDFGQRVDNSERQLLCRDGRLLPVLKTVVPITLGGGPACSRALSIFPIRRPWTRPSGRRMRTCAGERRKCNRIMC